MKKKSISVGVFTVLIILGGLVLLTSPLWAVHQVAWTPSQLTQEVVAGDSATVSISVTAERSALPNAVVEVSSELAGVVTVSPLELGTIPRGKSTVLIMTINPSSNTMPGTLRGMVIIRKRNGGSGHFSPGLPVAVNIKRPTVTNQGGFTVSVPPGYAAREVDQTKTVLEPTFEARAAGELPIVVEIDELRRGPALQDHLESLGIDAQNIEEVLVDGRRFLRSVDDMGDGLEDVSFTILSPTGQVVYVSTFSSAFADDPRFLEVVKSLSF